MEHTELIKRSNKGLKAQVIATGIVALIGALLLTWITDILFSWTPNEGRIISGLVWLLFIGGWVVTSLKLWSDWSNKRYEIAKDALIVHDKNGKWRTSQAIYRYESIISIRMTQNYLGRKYGYGDVHITIPKLDQEVIMNDIERPLEQLAEVQKRIEERSSTSNHLVT